MLTTASGWAFTQETLYPNGNGNYNFNYGPVDGSKSGDSKNKFDLGDSKLQFNIQHGQQTSPFGFHGREDDNMSSSYFHEPLGNNGH